MSKEKLKNAIVTLKQHEYRLIEKYERPEYYNIDESCHKLLGTFIDVETTGLDYKCDQIIELGLVVFEYSKDGRIFRIVDEYSQYQDPGIPIPIKTTKLTGITDEMVKNKNIDLDLVKKYISETNLIVAHNAKFDRSFIESFWPAIPARAWACSMSDIPWENEGIESTKLEYLAYKYEFYFEGHRATADCLAGIHILSKNLREAEKTVVGALLDNCRKTTFKLWAIDASFDYKDLLKNRGYQWSPEGQGKYKAWSIVLDEIMLEEELIFLWSNIYKKRDKLPIEIINAYNKFSILKSNISQEKLSDQQKYLENIYSRAEESLKSFHNS